MEAQQEEEQVQKKGPWTPEEDKLLTEYITSHGERRWSSVAKFSGLNRSGKSCRLRWVNYLRPGLKRGQITPMEEAIIIELHAFWGNKWSTIARYLPGRTDNEIKNFWRTHMKKKEKSSSSSSRRIQKQQCELQDPMKSDQEATTILINDESLNQTVFGHPYYNHMITNSNFGLEDDQHHRILPLISDDHSMIDEGSSWRGLWSIEDNSYNISAAQNEVETCLCAIGMRDACYYNHM